MGPASIGGSSNPLNNPATFPAIFVCVEYAKKTEISEVLIEWLAAVFTIHVLFVGTFSFFKNLLVRFQ